VEICNHHRNCKAIPEAAVLNSMPPFFYVQMDHLIKTHDSGNAFLDLPGVVCFHAEIHDQSMYALPTPSSTRGCFFMPLDAGDG